MRYVVPLLALTACAKGVVDEFEARRAAALAPITEVPAIWAPDAALTLREGLVRDAIQAGLAGSGALDRKVEIAGARTFVHPKLEVRALRLAPAPRCDTCLRVDADLEGELGWQIANSTGSAPLKAAVTFDVDAGASRDGDAFVIALRPRDVSKADLEVGGRTYQTVQRIAEGALNRWIRDEALTRVPPIAVARVPAADLPLRAARARPVQGGIVVELLSQAPATLAVTPAPLADGEDWSLAVDPGVLLHAARVASFEHGPVSHGVVVEPTALRLGEADFVLGMRLWRTTGRGWWRDLSVTGTVARTPRGFTLSATEAVEVGRSKGARIVDPLAALAEGTILRAVERAVSTTLPGGTTQTIGDVPVAIVVARSASAPRTVGGVTSEQIALSGTAKLGAAGPRPARGGARDGGREGSR